MNRVLKLVYNNKTNYMVDIVDKFKDFFIIEKYNGDLFRERKKSIPIQTRFGTKNFPLIVFEDENLEEIDAIWPENKPDWEKEIRRRI